MGRRPFLWPGLGLAVGILLARIFTFPIPFVFLLFLSLFPFLWASRGKRVFLPLSILAFVSLGILRLHETEKISPNDVSYFTEGSWVSLEGEVASLPVLKEKGKKKIYSFVLEAKNLVREKKFFETRGKVQVFLFNPGETALYGARVRLRGKLVSPKGARNPGEFDYRKYLADQGIRAVFEGYGPRALRILDGRGEVSSPWWRGNPAPADFFLIFIQKIREACVRRFDSLFPYPLNALLKALIVGIRTDLPEEFRDVFIKTGTAHLLAISGMHITLVGGSIFLLSLCLGLPQKAAAGVGLVSMGIYVIFSGAALPAVRAGWMTGLFLIGLLIERERDLLNSLFFALLAILVFDPKALFQVGFQLSFLSVLSLILLMPHREPDWKSEGFQTVVVLLGTFPLCVVYFNVFSWVSVFANLAAIPLFHLAVLGGIASILGGSAPLLGPFLIGATSLSLKAGLQWIEFWGEKPWGYFHLTRPSWELVSIYYCTLALCLLVHRMRRARVALFRPLATSLWLLAAGSFFIPGKNQEFALTVFAAGQNEIFHVEFPGRRHWLVNTGRGKASNQARWILNPFLRQTGVSRLQGILLTDFSDRHAGGLSALFGNFSIDSLLFPLVSDGSPDFRRLLETSRLKRTARIPFRPRDQIPIGEESGFHIVDVIEGQTILGIYYRDQKFLFLPSLKPKILGRAMYRLRNLLSVACLIFPAFGEPSPSQWQEILSPTRPRAVVFSKWKPTLEPFLELLKQLEIPYFFLSESGALRFEIRQGQWLISPYLSPDSTSN